VAAYERGDYATALSRFREALRLREHPVIAFNLALAESKNSLFLEAVNRLDAVAKDSRTPGELKARVASERELAARSLSTVIFDSPASQGLSPTVDGQVVDGSPPKTQVNPGQHRIVLFGPKGIRVEREVSLIAGETLRVVLDSASELRFVVAGSETKDKSPVLVQAHKGLSSTWFYVALGSTLAVGAVATWSGLDTLSAYRSYDRDLPGLTQRQANERVADGHGKENRTNLLVGATGFLAVGTTLVGLLLVDWQASPTVSVSPSVGGVMLNARF